MMFLMVRRGGRERMGTMRWDDWQRKKLVVRMPNGRAGELTPVPKQHREYRARILRCLLAQFLKHVKNLGRIAPREFGEILVMVACDNEIVNANAGTRRIDAFA